MKVDWPKHTGGGLRLDLEAVAFAEYVVGAQPGRPTAGTGRGLAAHVKGGAGPVAMFASHEKPDAEFGRKWLLKDPSLGGQDRSKWTAWDAWCVNLLRRPMFAKPGKFRRSPAEQQHFRIRLCPETEAGNTLAKTDQMQDFTRRFMGGLERDYGGRLVWVAAVHLNTDQPHAHIGMRGISAEGEHVFFSQKYLRPSKRELMRKADASAPIEWRARGVLAEMMAEIGGERAAG